MDVRVCLPCTTPDFSSTFYAPQIRRAFFGQLHVVCLASSDRSLSPTQVRHTRWKDVIVGNACSSCLWGPRLRNRRYFRSWQASGWLGRHASSIYSGTALRWRIISKRAMSQLDHQQASKSSLKPSYPFARQVRALGKQRMELIIHESFADLRHVQLFVLPAHKTDESSANNPSWTAETATSLREKT